ncbi:NAD(P)-dependent oxidoreductase [Martelella lutilitoris]|uniref:NAD(P)-dependent oxidoreductase n=1 Tax=Martelella lutilitoris TaxID=2583532 RepID=A0A5C4JX84_9HYPH|nr:NAD(P)-dependent oxidoreductase [Martelella lutilitoris]TNB49894.1 NAD(P)-dependent oxidoreductase [Martelella lutilitoris]
MTAIGFIGFGEAARAIADGWAAAGIATSIAAFDIKTLQDDTAEAITEACQTRGVFCAPDSAALLQRSDIVFSLVTADNAFSAAEAAAPHIRPGTLYLDGNSCSPQTKRRNAALIDAAGALYVDVAIMSPIHPKRHETPCLVSGPHATQGAEAMAGLGMNGRVTGPEIGDASSVKMIRSVMIKGTEALMAECFLAAEKAGVSAEVLASLSASDPQIDWPRRAAYCLERMMVHGTRRAAEMREVAATVSDLGLEPRMSAATVAWQAEIGAYGMETKKDDGLAERVALVLAAMGQDGREE